MRRAVPLALLAILAAVASSGCSSPQGRVAVGDVRLGTEDFSALCDDEDQGFVVVTYRLDNLGATKATRVAVDVHVERLADGAERTQRLQTVAAFAGHASRSYESYVTLFDGCEGDVGTEDGYEVTVTADPGNGKPASSSARFVCDWAWPDTAARPRCG